MAINSTASPNDRFYIPASIGTASREALAGYYAILRGMEKQAEPSELADFDAANAAVEAAVEPLMLQVTEQLNPGVAHDVIGGVPVLRVTPAIPNSARGPLLYIHGGGWSVFSAWSTRGVAAIAAAASGREVISIDYTLAPRGNYLSITSQILDVWAGLLALGHRPEAMGIFGDSAGGNITAASVLRMRDRGMPLPGALVLMSPATDLTWSGDTLYTLAEMDPGLERQAMPGMAKAYVGGDDPRHAYASPVFGDYTKPYPPTLIQAGTREFLLSDSVRLYQAIRSGGHDTVLDVYEGMPHVFQAFLAATTEGATAWARAAEFFNARLAA
ncbi:acetyl esterase/lipase [Sphingomonas sp. PP-F2F-A104-K0414]|uniref:alpha/beta hydrolase n=1 Tax=Sphingomonas sp. PP-F2F-A104-K0414 TaxID=2135661 RepID=UPI001047F144|nr:alpha/beta hydrolase [Sphingomonas sp. PP-F2F-A104-K0414]TCP97413.1 acetyl esterase/lipase [Sphingomonas sp. PP-F2F-A104-K0414]